MEERWRPLRAGLVDLFYYDIEEFHFHGGNLLLRGNNGTGKSKVLALTLPFLLDGELAAHRVEPDGDKNKRMEWNLLLGGRFPHNERLGYTWLEFGRMDSDGVAYYVTVGCGLKAVKDRGIARHWFFVTDQRIGPELSLVSAARTALPRERLKEALGTRGVIYDRASDYRRAVDQALFGLGPRYEALISLLIQLRQPQLSKRPDERLLSRALTEALAPLDENLLMQVAEAFRSLDDERTTLSGLQEAKKSADDFLTSYRRYARIAAKRKAAGVRTAQSRYEQLGRDLGEQERASAEAEAALIAAEQQLAELYDQKTVLNARQRALEDSPEMRAAKDLEQADNFASSMERIAVAQVQLLSDAVQSEREADRVAQAARTEAANALAAKESAALAAEKTAAGAHLAQEHRDRVVDHPEARQNAEALVNWRAQSLSNLEALLSQARTAQRLAAEERRVVDRLGGELSLADERIVAAEDAATEAGTQLVAAIRRYLDETVQLRVADMDAVLTALEVWVDNLDGDNPAAMAIAQAVQAAAHQLVKRETQLTSALGAAHDRKREAEEELSRLSAGGHDDPPLPHTRSAHARSGPGAPLWKIIDFHPGVPEEERAGLEAALEAAGILDAWVLPEGLLLDPDTDDIIVTGGAGIDANLGQYLTAAEQPVRSVLESIGLGADSGAPTWVDASGRFGNGVLTGQWRKDSAVHIGEGAREAVRRKRIADLTKVLAGIQAEIEGITAQLSEIVARQRILTEEQQRSPGDVALRDAFTVVRSEHDARRRIDEKRRIAEQRAQEADDRAQETHEKSVEFADDMSLPADSRALKMITEALGEYRVALAAWWPAAATAAAASKRVTAAEADHAKAAAKVEPAREASDEATANATSARERHSTLLAASSASIAELQRQLGALKVQLSQVDGAEKRAGKQEREALNAKGVAEGKLETLTAEIARAGTERDGQVELLRQFATTGLLELACPEVETPDRAQLWAATPAVQTARNIDRELSEVDDADRRWELAQQHVSNDSKTLIDGLSRHGHRAAVLQRDDVLVVDVTFQGRTAPVVVLAGVLGEEVEERQRLLSAHEREILENHLVSEVAGTLQELITAAERQVETMNQELQQRPTSTGMRLRLVWRAAKDAPAGLAELRERQLRQTTDVWNEEDRRVVGTFLQQQINNERLRDDAGTWTEQLTRALDYRSWHEFAIQRHQDGQWRPATGPASGGERVLAASIPLFAAAASYYSSAHPHAPRLIALDEAFAGVDDDSRAKCLGLLATFDLDVVMTSEREWGCYPQVPGLAIAQLARRDDVDAVLVTPWRWDGHGSKYQVPRPVPFVPVQSGPPVEDVLL